MVCRTAISPTFPPRGYAISYWKCVCSIAPYSGGGVIFVIAPASGCPPAVTSRRPSTYRPCASDRRCELFRGIIIIPRARHSLHQTDLPQAHIHRHVDRLLLRQHPHRILQQRMRLHRSGDAKHQQQSQRPK